VPLSRPDRYAKGVNDRQVVLDRAADAYRALLDLAETVEDEWQYINDLGEAYLPGIVALGISSGAAGELGDAQVAAVDEAIAEIAVVVEMPRQEFFASSGFAEDVDGNVGSGDARGFRQKPVHDGAAVLSGVTVQLVTSKYFGADWTMSNCVASFV